MTFPEFLRKEYEVQGGLKSWGTFGEWLSECTGDELIDLATRWHKESLPSEDQMADAIVLYVLENKIDSLKILTYGDFRAIATALRRFLEERIKK